MKNNILIAVLFLTFTLFGQKHEVLQHFDTSGMKTSVLYQESPLFTIADFQKNNNNLFGYYQVYKGLQQSDFENRMPSLAVLKNKVSEVKDDEILPLSILLADYETVKNEALKNGTVYQDELGFMHNTSTESSIYKQNSIFISTALALKHKGLEVNFILEKTAVYNLSNNEITSIKIDFNDGFGFKTIEYNKIIPIRYKGAGEKHLDFEITLENGKIEKNTAILNILYSNADRKRIFDTDVITFTSSITADLSVYGEEISYPGVGEYQIFYSTGAENELNKPLFIIDGFDPQDGRSIEGYTDLETGEYHIGIYDLLNYENESGETLNLGDMIREEGFDIVILNFPEYIREEDDILVDGGADFVERNAMLLVELINTINAEKVGDEQNVIIGPSMGGLISRYALNYMENQEIAHDTRLWLSFDSPHLGANVPIGFQHQFNFLAYGLDDFWFIGDQNVEALHPLVAGFMQSAAARQMLVDHMEPHITSDDGVSFDSSLVLPIAHPYKEIFYNRMNALTDSGFPENLRKVSLINGSGTGEHYVDKEGEDILPGRMLVDTTIDVQDGVEAFLEVSFTPYADQQIEVSEVYIDFAWWVPAFDVENKADSKAHIYSDGVDASSGGLFNLGQVAETVGTEGLAGAFLDALQTDYFCFIPSVSAMAISFPDNEIDWHQLPNESNPFDAWYVPTHNESHVTFSTENVAFAWNEIVVLPYVSTEEFAIASHIQIAKNPSDQLVLICDESIDSFAVSIFDYTGKQVMENKVIQATQQTRIPVLLESGVYFVQLQVGQEKKIYKYISL